MTGEVIKQEDNKLAVKINLFSFFFFLKTQIWPDYLNAPVFFKYLLLPSNCHAEGVKFQVEITAIQDKRIPALVFLK